MRTMPPNQAVSLQVQRRLNAKHGQQPPIRDVAALILKKSKSLLRDGVPSISARDVKLAVCPSQKMSYLKANSVDLVVTSPPFLNTVDYKKDNWAQVVVCGVEGGDDGVRCPCVVGALAVFCARQLCGVCARCAFGGGVWRSRWGRCVREGFCWRLWGCRASTCRRVRW